VFGDRRFDAAQIMDLAIIAGRSAQLTGAALGFDVGSGRAPDADAIGRTFVAHQVQIAPMFAFMTDAAGALSQALNEAGGQMPFEPVHRDEVHAGLLQGFGGCIGVAASPELSNASRQLVTAALVRNVPAVARALPPGPRNLLLQQARSSRATMGPQLRAEMDKVIAALEQTGCTGFCAA
jgi:hypothetical protein